MSVAPLANDTLCGHCQAAQKLVQKYLKLVALQQKRIRHLEKKYSEMSGRSQLEDTNTFAPLPSSLIYNSHHPLSLPQTQAAHQSTQTEWEESRLADSGEWMLQRTEKVGSLVNSLTAEIMQIKTNFLHVRFCVYALVRQLRGGETQNPIAVNLVAALVSMLQFSEEEKQEMLGKKVKHRKRTRNSDKENVFVTIKEL